MAENVITAAIAIVKVKGEAVGLMRTISYSENFRRQPVKGLGTILPSEIPVTDWSATLTCESMVISPTKSGIKNAVRYDLPNVRSQVELGNPSFEDELVLNPIGIQVDLFKKVGDVFNPDGTIKPKLKPMAIVPRIFIESSSLDLSEGGIMSKRQSFQCMDPIVELS